MLFALFRIPWLLFPAVAVAGFAAGVVYTSDHTPYHPRAAELPTQAAVYRLQLERDRLEQAQRQRHAFIQVCQGIAQTNPAMLTPQCRQVLWQPIPLLPRSAI